MGSPGRLSPTPPRKNLSNKSLSAESQEGIDIHIRTVPAEDEDTDHSFQKRFTDFALNIHHVSTDSGWHPTYTLWPPASGRQTGSHKPPLCFMLEVSKAEKADSKDESSSAARSHDETYDSSRF